MLQNGILTQGYLVVDALDECEAGDPGPYQLLDLVSEVAERCDKVKWLLSSRNTQDIAKAFEGKETRTRLSLELNSKTVTKVVEAYITYKTSSLFQDYETALGQRTTPRLQKFLRSTKKFKKLRSWRRLTARSYRCHSSSSKSDAPNVVPTSSVLSSGGSPLACIICTVQCFRASSRMMIIWIMLRAYGPMHISELEFLAGLPALADHSQIVRRSGLLVIREDDD
jgi:hypothetical protein